MISDYTPWLAVELAFCALMLILGLRRLPDVLAWNHRRRIHRLMDRIEAINEALPVLENRANSPMGDEHSIERYWDARDEHKRLTQKLTALTER